MPEWARNFLASVGGRNSISLKAYVYLAPLAIVAPIPTFSPELRTSHLPALIAISSIGYLASGAVFLLARLTYLRPKQGVSRPISALLTFFIAGAVIGLTISGLAQATGLETAPAFLDRTLGRGWFGVFWSSMIAVLMDSRQRYIDTATRLQASIAETKRLVEERVEIVSQLRADLIGLIKQTLTALVEHPTPAKLNKLADEVIRPLSHFLGLQSSVSAIRLESPIPKIKIAPILKNSYLRPKLTWVQIVIAGLSSSFTLSYLLTAWAPLNLTFIFVVLFLTSRVQNRNLNNRMLFATFYWLTALIAVSGVVLIYGVHHQDSVLRVVAINAGSLLLAMFLSFQRNLDIAREENLEALEKQLVQLDWHRSKLRQEIWIESRKLAKYVHGDIQGRIRAAALGSSTLTNAELEALTQACIEVLESKPGQVSIRDFIKQSREIWAGAMTIEFSMDDFVDKAVEADPFASESIIEILREAMINAVRHGQATKMHIKAKLIDHLGSRAVLISAINDGKTLDSDFGQGMGCDLYSELTAQWRLTSDEQGVVLLAWIPVQPTLQGSQRGARLPNTLA